MAEIMWRHLPQYVRTTQTLIIYDVDDKILTVLNSKGYHYSNLWEAAEIYDHWELWDATTGKLAERSGSLNIHRAALEAVKIADVKTLSQRTKNALINDAKTNMFDVFRSTLRYIPNIGRKGVVEIQDSIDNILKGT